MGTKAELSVKQAAQVLRIGLVRVYQLVWAGQLPATRKDGKWWIPIAAVQTRLKARRGCAPGIEADRNAD